ncbi:MAG: ferric reductase-like transmembrane domain-containing protein [Candidatus Daviesbacteria bacterium]|nr:ferric reductase-like transmembrane domain-containing protein [Candidatus Daviesbacteria bacterium]
MKKRGLLLILISIIACTFLYLTAKPSPYFVLQSSLSAATQITALWGMVLFTITFFLSSRFNFLESIFGPLDKIYKLHQVIARFTVVFLILHVLFLILNSIDNSKMLSRVVLPSSILSFNLGIFSLWSLIVTISVIIYAKIEYQWFVRIQRLFIIPLVLGIAHMLLIKSDSSRYLPLTIFLVFFAFLGFISWFYRVFLYSRFGPKFKYSINSFQMLSDDVFEITLKPEGKKINFQPGQFVYIEFDAPDIPNELHPFSICSSPKDDNLRFIVKTYGSFTNHMRLLRTGDSAVVFGPYGFLGRYFLKATDAVCIAGGIGVTPFLSMVNYLEDHKDFLKKVSIFYCAKDEHDAIFKEELNDKAKVLPNLNLECLTTEKNGLLKAEAVKDYVGELKDKVFFLCGPAPMMKSLSKQLRAIGVPSGKIVYEDFDYR